MLTPDEADNLATAKLLDPPPPEMSPDGFVREHADQLPKISGYRVHRLIASGGMGAVYEAEQERPRRTVAIKVMRPGLITSSASGVGGGVAGHRHAAHHRLECEAEVLGQLKHPGIAQIFQAGTHDDGVGGAPYFVMEHIEGAVPITDWSRQHRLDIRERLDLFIKVCDAVHYAHRKGFIHRDVKPANLLMAEGGQPKVIDFGIARATNADITLATLASDLGSLVGTVQYMSPEQCEGDAADLDTRSDVYSLGVVLYELLCGRPPYELKGASLVSATRIVRKREPMRPREIVRGLHRDLETILLKAIEKDREKRYQSAAELASDVRRFLDGEPIEARPPGALTHLARLARRHPLAVTAMVCGLMVAGTAISTALAVGYLRHRPYSIEVAADHLEARLVSVAGDVLRTWRAEKGLYAMGPLPAADEAIVLIGYEPGDGAAPRRPLRAYDTHDRGEGPPLWAMGLDDRELPDELVARGFIGDEFGVRWLGAANIFQESPGREIIAVFGHWMYSHALLRVLDTNGKVLFQFWHDGNISHAHWLAEPGLLIVIGLNGEAYWEHRGAAGLTEGHPRVVFAVRPELGRVERDWLRTRPEDGVFAAAWYKCLRPEAQERSWRFRYYPLTPARRNRSEIGVEIEFDCYMCTLTMTLDEHGGNVPGGVIRGDGFNRWDEAPDPALFELIDLPPILPEYAHLVGPGRETPARRDRAD